MAQLQKEVAGAVVGRACAVAEAVKEIEGKYTEIFQVRVFMVEVWLRLPHYRRCLLIHEIVFVVRF